jgi:hypothetical protein
MTRVQRSEEMNEDIEIGDSFPEVKNATEKRLLEEWQYNLKSLI